MTEDMIAKAKEAQSAEELLQLAKDNGMDDFTMQDAEDLYAQMHASGEMSDEEMENVSGGCSTTVDGKKYKVVTCDTNCFTGKWQNGCPHFTPIRDDFKGLRSTWYSCANGTKENKCGSCYHLGIKSSGTGYCEVQYD